jgi:predicted nucleic-acid-binding protein
MQITVLRIECCAEVAAAHRLFKEGKADFADCLIERSSDDAGCGETLTFDIRAATSANMALIR